MRPISSTGRPRRKAARARVTYLGIERLCFMTAPLCAHQREMIFFHAHDHVLVDIDVPAFTDSHADGLATFLEELSAKRNLDIAESDLKDDRLPHPTVVNRSH